MARRTEERRHDVEAPPPGPPEKSGPFWLGWIALATVIALGVGLYVYMSRSPNRPHPLPSSQASSSPGASPSAPTTPASQVGLGVPATTFGDFVALPPAQQQVVMTQAIHHYLDVGNEAFRTLNPARLPEVATGGELSVLQQAVQSAIQNQQPISYQGQLTLLHIVMSPQPYSFVSIEIQSTETGQYLDPKTLQPIGAPSTTNTRSTFSFVIEDGVWKVRDHIQEPTS